MLMTGFLELQKFKNRTCRAGLLGGCVLLLSVGAAQAGFEWIPSQKNPTVSERNTTIHTPSSGVAHVPVREALSPLPQSNISAPPSAPVGTPQKPKIQFKKLGDPTSLTKVPPRQKFDPAPTLPPPDLNLPVVQAPQPHVILPADTPASVQKHVSQRAPLQIQPFPSPSTTERAPTAPISANEELVGFGTDIPLALALRDIAPPEYAFSFDASINPGTKVSWNGGKIWSDVMADMIAPLGLHAKIQGKVISIRHGQRSALPSDVPSAAHSTTIRRNFIQDPGENPHGRS